MGGFLFLFNTAAFFPSAFIYAPGYHCNQDTRGNRDRNGQEAIDPVTLTGRLSVLFVFGFPLLLLLYSFVDWNS